MPSLHELQRAFSAAALFGDAAALASLRVVAAGVTPEARIGIYRGNVLGNYRKALAATYPVIRRLVGAPFFDAVSDHFVGAHPSTRGDINRYGATFADFLRAYPPARDLSYLPDVARLEWAVDQANIARDAEPFDLPALATVPAEMHGELRFSLHPSAQLIASPFPILHIWRANQPESTADESIDLDEGGDTLLVLRRIAGIVIERIPPPDHMLLGELAAGRTLGEAAAGCAARFADFNLATALQRYVGMSAIVAFHLPWPAGFSTASGSGP
jgi:hypothetical protein